VGTKLRINDEICPTTGVPKISDEDASPTEGASVKAEESSEHPEA